MATFAVNISHKLMAVGQSLRLCTTSKVSQLITNAYDIAWSTPRTFQDHDVGLSSSRTFPSADDSITSTSATDLSCDSNQSQKHTALKNLMPVSHGGQQMQVLPHQRNTSHNYCIDTIAVQLIQNRLQDRRSFSGDLSIVSRKDDIIDGYSLEEEDIHDRAERAVSDDEKWLVSQSMHGFW